MTRHLVFAMGAVAAVIVALVMGFREAGSPDQQRLLTADEMRLQALDRIQAAIRSRARDRGLPENLEGLPSQYGMSLTDPETAAPYEYRRLNDDEFELCAVFAAPHEPSNRALPWDRAHGAGRQCFTYRR